MKKRKLKEIKIEEVSLVDRPANQIPFLTFKRDGKSDVDSLLKAKTKIKIEIESDGTKGGTAVTLDGDKIVDMESFNFNVWSDVEDESKINCSYSKKVESEGGFQRTETYYLVKKGKIMNKKLEKMLRTFDENAEFAKANSVEDTLEAISKAMELVETYKSEFPEELTKAIGVLALEAALSTAPVKKEEQEATALELSTDIGTMVKHWAGYNAEHPELSTLEKKQETSKSDTKPEASDLQKTVEQLAKSVSEITTSLEKKDASDKLMKISEQLEGVTKRLKAVEDKPVTTKKSLSNNEENNEVETKKEEGVIWPSLSGEKQED